MIVSAPASSANLGPGFDALGLAIDLRFSLCLNEQPRGGAWEPVVSTHPAMVAYEKVGGVTPMEKIWAQSHIPFARGLGFSGAARVAGAYAAFIQNGMNESDARDHAFRAAGYLEGHDDNAAASTYGGFCVTTSGHVMRFDCEPHMQGLRLVFFVPELTFSTDKSRSMLPDSFSKDDLVASVGNVSLLTAMLASNTFNDEVLGIVTRDVIHQPVRLQASEPSQKAYDAFREHGAVAQWLSGGGSSVAALVAEENAADLIAAMEKLEVDVPFTCSDIEVDQDGVRVENLLEN